MNGLHSLLLLVVNSFKMRWRCYSKLEMIYVDRQTRKCNSIASADAAAHMAMVMA